MNFSIKTDVQPNDDSRYGSQVIIALDSLPNERLKRNVVRSKMDLIGMYYFTNLKEQR